MEELETLESTECPECPGPPPEFRLPPPPRPPFLTEGTFCSESPLAELEDCVAIPMIDASYHTNPSLQSTALIITCAVVLLLMAAIVSVVFWKHKRKVQNLLPCKSAAGAAAVAGRSRVLPDGQPHSGPGIGGGGGGGGGAGGGGAGGAVLYEDLQDHAMSHSQLHNHLPTSHGQAPTIEVRNPEAHPRVPPPPREPPLLPARREKRPPQPHHLDYLDYRDPRSILRVQDKPSRAVLGGYRTPRALLAKSQGVPLSIAATAQSSAARLAPGGTPGANSPLLLRNESNLLRDSHLLLATQNALITSQRPPSPPTPPSPILSRGEFPQTCRDLDVGLTADGYPADVRVPARPRDSGIPITPTHRPRLRASPARTPSTSPNAGPTTMTTSTTTTTVPRLAVREEGRRRLSVDSEGYSYIDFKDSELESMRYGRTETAIPLSNSRRLLRSTTARSSSIDSDGYSYIVDYGRRAPGAARRLVADGTEEEVCPLCTMQQIHHLLSQPEQDVYLHVQDT
ncbi:WAS/WASL-interacting protein family member 1 isoform X2 [Solenopsis invicta]|uniref:WAS/WASL-interacting protein family member 1 isoform X2 n=1 Tax=Solenopsis invicta TaxID=13686 RepID=UPI00193EBE26|nr:WAS/WASL-interacting protein family member 1 isoform X2 [Solenopsis invicta]